jgi:hypothetical protein
MKNVLANLKGRALDLTGKAVGKLLEDPGRAEKVAAAVGAVQRGKQRVDKVQGQVANAVGFASAGDYKDLQKRISAARRKAKALLEKLEKLG